MNIIHRNSNRIFDISYERIHDELVKMIMIGKPREMIRLLTMSDLNIIPDVMNLRDVEQDPIWHPEGSAIEHTIRVMENLVGESLELQLAGMFHDVGKATTTIVDKGRIKSPGHAKEGAKIAREALRKLKFGNKTIEYVGELVYDHMKIIEFEKMRKSKQIIFMNRPDFQDLRKLHIADKKGGNGNLRNIEYLDSIEIVKKEDPIISGSDIIAVGITDGKTIGKIKNELYHLQLEGMDEKGLRERLRDKLFEETIAAAQGYPLLQEAIGGFLKEQLDNAGRKILGLEDSNGIKN